MLQISESPESLFDQIASDLAQIRDPRARHWLVFPQPARSNFVMHAWARKSGIASHSQTVELRTLLEQVAAGTKPRFQFESLKLAIAMALPEVQRHPGSFLPETAVLEPISPAVLEWAGALANAMDDTLLSRTPAARWEPGSFLDALAKQAGVARTLSLHMGNVLPDEFDLGLDAWTAAWDARGGVPHLWIQLDAGLPQIEFALFTRLFTRLSHSHPDRLHLYALSPTSEFWADACLRAKNRRAGLLDLTTDELSPGGVLWAFGRNAQSLHRQLAGTLLAEGDGGHFIPAPPPSHTLLGKIQLSCRTAAPLPSEERICPSPEDCSFTVHACRNALRELENCRDRILQALADDPGLRPEEVVVLLANPETQAPLVEAAFRPEICPFRLLGFGKTVPSPLSTGFERLFEALRGRVTLEQIRALVEHPLVAARFGFEPGQGEALDPLRWLQDARFLWGIDSTHRRQFQEIEEPRWNLFWAIQRLGLGAVFPPDTLGVPVALPGAGCPLVPLERATGLSLKNLAAFALFAARLAEARKVWSTDTARPLSEWLHRVADLVQNLFDLKKAGLDAAPFSQLVLSPLRQTAAGCDPNLTPAAFLRLLQPRLELLGQDSIRGPGGICIADLRHYAGIPARMIVVAGLNQDTFPARDDRPEWHPLARQPQTGDPSRRDADRHAFLLAILAARERLVLSFLGGSDTDAKPRPPSTALADLLQILETEILAPATPEPRLGSICFSHPLNGFSHQQDGVPANLRSFLASDQMAAALLQNRQGFPPLPGLWSLQIAAPNPEIALSDFAALLKEPATVFLRSLGVRLPEEAEVPPAGDLLDLDGLASWKIREALLPARLEGGDEALVLKSLEHAGHIPRGRLGVELEHRWLDKLPQTPVPALSPNQRFQPALRIALAIQPDGSERLLTGQVRHLWYRVADPAHGLVHYSASQDSLEKRLGLFLEALCMAATADPDLPLPARAALYFQTGKPVEFSLPKPDTAESLLRSLLPLYDLARSRPLPYWVRSSDFLLAAKPVDPASEQDPPVDSLLEVYRENWEGDLAFGGPGDSESPHTRFAFRGCPNPFVLMAPETAAAFLPEPARPLSWRIIQFLRAWCSAAGLPLSQTHV